MDIEPSAPFINSQKVEQRALIVEELKGMIKQHCDLKDLDLTAFDPDALLINGPTLPRLDSLDAIEIAVAVARRYNVMINDASSAKATMRSLNSLADHILKARK